MTYINSTLTIEKNFFNQSEIADIVKEEIKKFKRFATNQRDARKRQFFYSIQKSESVFNVKNWYDRTGQAELEESGITWQGNDFGQKLFGINKQGISKLYTSWVIVEEDADAPENFYNDVLDYESETGKTATLSIEAFKKWWANDKVLKELIVNENADADGTSEESDTDADASEETSEESTSSNTEITFTSGSINFRKQDGQFISSEDKLVLIAELERVTAELEASVVITSADFSQLVTS